MRSLKLFCDWTRRLVENIFSELIVPRHNPGKPDIAELTHLIEHQAHVAAKIVRLLAPRLPIFHAFIFLFAWSPAAFVHVLRRFHLDLQVRFYKHLDTIKRRKLMGPERINALAECTGGRPILIG